MIDFGEDFLLDYKFYLLCLLGLAVVIQLVYHWGVFARLAFYRQKRAKKETENPVSVVVCAKNEYHNLQKNLPLILCQDYSDYEVVVVNDASDDETGFLLENLSREYERLKVVTINQNLNFFSGKKFPLSIGIRSASHELILLTDADCRPASNNWLREMQQGFGLGTDIVLGYGAYEKRKGLLNLLIRFDTFQVALQYLSFSLAGLTYMGVGRNLAYRKSLFFANNGFISHYKVSSGDDDLFINSVATAKNTRIVVNPQAHTLSEPKIAFKSWFRQKRRHLTTGIYYKPKFKWLLGTYSFSQLLFFALIVALPILHYQWLVVMLLFALRWLSQLVVLYKAGRVLETKLPFVFFPLVELFFLILTARLFLSKRRAKQQAWS